MAVVSKASDELKEIRKENMEELFEYRKSLYDKPQLRHLFLEVTSRCNARCEHCGSSCGDYVPTDEISAEELKNRLIGRGTEDLATIEKRLRRAVEESESMDNYDSFVKTVKDMGIDKVINIYQKATDSYYSR